MIHDFCKNEKVRQKKQALKRDQEAGDQHIDL